MAPLARCRVAAELVFDVLEQALDEAEGAGCGARSNFGDALLDKGVDDVGDILSSRATEIPAWSPKTEDRLHADNTDKDTQRRRAMLSLDKT